MPTIESFSLANVKFFVDPDYLENAGEVALIQNVMSVEELAFHDLRGFLENRAQESEYTIVLSSFDSIVRSELRMDLSDRSAQSRVEILFISYQTLLRRNGLDISL